MKKQVVRAPLTGDLIERFQRTQKFPLDGFQKEAMQALCDGRSVLVSAPTGSGKTIVAEFAIFLARESGRRCIYTTPLKALSNQKFRDLKEVMGDEVGLVTGDVVINPDAPVLIMTTEILRNILQADPARVDDVSHVILDEAHYIGADGRGTVWEETIVFLGKNTSIVALSATIPNADELATWVSSVHKPMDVILHVERPVPLEPWIAVSKLEPLFDKRGKLRMRTFTADGWVESPQSSNVVKELHKKGMTPAIFFVFSRMGCEKEAMEVIRSGVELTTKEEQKAITKAVEEALTQTPGMIASNATKAWLERLSYGVAPHHAGLLPPLKLLIEILFQRNLLKVVFATETLAAGINMPARTVVITSLSKRTDEGHRMLTVSEFAQMTGRAGRRGMDTVGYGVVLASHRYSMNDVVALFKGQPEPLRSRFTLNFNMVINLLANYEEAQCRKIVEQCFSQFQNNATVAQLHTLELHVRDKLDARDLRCPRYPDEFERGHLLGLHDQAKKAVADKRELLTSLEKNSKGSGQTESIRMLKAAPFHSWLVIKRQTEADPEFGLLLDKWQTKRKDVQFSVLLSGNRLCMLKSSDLMVATGVVARGVPGYVRDQADNMSYNQVRRLKGDLPWDQWLEDSGLHAADFLPENKEPRQLGAARLAFTEAEATWKQMHCFDCKFQRRCKDEDKETARLLRDQKAYNEQIEAIRGKYWRQFKVLQRVLEEGGYIRARKLLPRGVALANLRTSNELVAAETMAAGLLEGLQADELCAVVSGVVAEPIRGRMAWRPVNPSPAVVTVNDEMIDIAKHVDRLLERCKAEEISLYVVFDYAGMVQAWAGGHKWAHVVERTGIDEGQLVRHLRQVIDMLNQLKDVPGNDENFRERCLSALALIDRDIVKEVF
ncbi:MAG: box helicase [Cyanobacteria bacterium RYN_339]|nr:box helicase [Cyanobacteria bacterium RYN_339]